MTDPAGAAGDWYGVSVAIAGDYAIVGAYADDIGANTDQGSSTIYLRVGPEWQKLQFVTDPGGKPINFLGGSCGIDDTTKRFLIGANAYAGNSGKVVFGKVN